MRKSGLNLSGIKENNRALILQMICTAGQITRSELAARSRLSQMTVTNIVNELLGKKLIEEQGRLTVPGRPILYGTTADFLRTFGLSSLEELPEVELPQGKVNPEQIEMQLAIEEGGTEE